jgi:hypothetical protein
VWLDVVGCLGEKNMLECLNIVQHKEGFGSSHNLKDWFIDELIKTQMVHVLDVVHVQMLSKDWNSAWHEWQELGYTRDVSVLDVLMNMGTNVVEDNDKGNDGNKGSNSDEHSK